MSWSRPDPTAMVAVDSTFIAENDPAYIALIDSARFPPNVSVNISDDTPTELQMNDRLDAFYASPDETVVKTNRGRIRIISPTNACKFIGLDIRGLLDVIPLEDLHKRPNYKKVPVCNGNDPQSILDTVADTLDTGGILQSMWHFGARYVAFKINDNIYTMTLMNIPP